MEGRETVGNVLGPPHSRLTRTREGHFECGVLKVRVKEIDFVGVGVGVRRQEGVETRFHVVECATFWKAEVNN